MAKIGNEARLILKLAKERMEEILATHEIIPLPDDVEKEIGKILQEAREYYKKIGLS